MRLRISRNLTFSYLRFPIINALAEKICHISQHSIQPTLYKRNKDWKISCKSEYLPVYLPAFVMLYRLVHLLIWISFGALIDMDIGWCTY